MVTQRLRTLAWWFLQLVPGPARRYCRVTVLLYDERAIVVGVAVTPAWRTVVWIGLQLARAVAARRLGRPVRLKQVPKGAYVIMARRRIASNAPTRRGSTV